MAHDVAPTDPGAGEAPAPPLAGVRILDLTRLLPGAACTLALADLGADVVKVEEPGVGDGVRRIGPMVGDRSAAHAALNRGKRSITLNLKDPAGTSLLARLAARADVVLEGFRPGVLDRLGIGEDRVRATNPAIVWCSLTGFGQDGPYRRRAGHDLNYVGLAGLLALDAGPDGEPDVPGVQMADLTGGLAAAIGILAALAAARSSGRGRRVDVGMLDAAFWLLSAHLGPALVGGDPWGFGGGVLFGELPCYRVYRTRDGGFVSVGALEPKFWATLCEALGVPHLAAQQFPAPERRAEVAAALQAVFLTRDRDDWAARLADLDACVAPVLGVGEAVGDPQVRHRGMVAEVAGWPVGPGPLVHGPGMASGAALRRAPGLGEHTGELLAEIGVGPDEVDALRRRGVL